MTPPTSGMGRGTNKRSHIAHSERWRRASERQTGVYPITPKNILVRPQHSPYAMLLHDKYYYLSMGHVAYNTMDAYVCGIWALGIKYKHRVNDAKTTLLGRERESPCTVRRMSVFLGVMADAFANPTKNTGFGSLIMLIYLIFQCYSSLFTWFSRSIFSQIDCFRLGGRPCIHCISRKCDFHMDECRESRYVCYSSFSSVSISSCALFIHIQYMYNSNLSATIAMLLRKLSK